MIDDDTIDAMAETLRKEGVAVLDDFPGGKLVVMGSPVLGPGFVVGVDGQSMAFITSLAELTTYRLVEKGFRLRIAPLVCATVSRLFAQIADTHGELSDGLVPLENDT